MQWLNYIHKIRPKLSYNMDAQKCMIVDLERRGDKRMFITEQVASISENKNGLWTVRFSSSPHVFNYNHSRLLYRIH